MSRGTGPLFSRLDHTEYLCRNRDTSDWDFVAGEGVRVKAPGTSASLLLDAVERVARAAPERFVGS
jgi:hypothetical protein